MRATVVCLLALQALSAHHTQATWWFKDGDLNTNETEAEMDMAAMDANLTAMAQWVTEIDWEYNTNQNDNTSEASTAAWNEFNKVYAAWHAEVIQAYDWSSFSDVLLKRQFQLQSNMGTAALSDEDVSTFNEIVKNMENAYGNTICPYGMDDCNEEEALGISDLEELMRTERDYDVLLYYWKEWRLASGREMVEDYGTYIELLNQAAENNGFNDASEMWVTPYVENDLGYTADKFKTEVEELWNATQGLYHKLHAYVLFNLKQNYTEISENERLIPAHLLGNMWAQSWENIYDLVQPTNTTIPSIDDELAELDDVNEMFRMSEDFFVSLGLWNMTDDFWDNTLFTEPANRSVVCHASAWDFFDTENMPNDGRFRIKMCTKTNQEDFIVIHHEMGHTQYQMSYSPRDDLPTDRPLIFRNGANPGFHEAIGDTIALSVSTPAHLEMISDYITGSDNTSAFAQSRVDNVPDEDINALMKTALAKVAFLPYAYILDKWRWELFTNTHDDIDYNRKWWDMRLNLQGVYPPEERFPESDFDPGSKFHVASNVPYIRYFVAHILQFQFHERLCREAGNTEEIYNCDIYESMKAGSLLKSMLEKGASEPWTTQLAEFMGTEDAKMDASALLQYFKPLENFLDMFIEENELTVGWDKVDVEKYMKVENDIPPTVPIIVGVVLAVMVLIVLVAYFVGQRRQKKKQKVKDALSTTPAYDNPAFDSPNTGSVELGGGKQEGASEPEQSEEKL